MLPKEALFAIIEVVIKNYPAIRASGMTAEEAVKAAVALVEAMRDEGGDPSAERAQGLGEQAGRGDSVHVEIAEHGDLLAGVERPLDAVGNGTQAGDDGGIGPVALKRGGKEVPSLLYRGDAVRDHDARDEGRHVEGAGELVF